MFLPHLVAMVAALLSQLALPPSRGLAALSLIAAIFAVSRALSSGGAYLTPSGVFMIAAGVFVGGGGYYLGKIEVGVRMVDVRNATFLALISTIAISMVVTALSIRWRVRWTPRPLVGDATTLAPPRQFALRAVILVVASQLPPVQSVLGAAAPAIGLCGVLMLSLVGSSRRLGMRRELDLAIMALAVAAPVMWVALDFTGGGRIVVAGLGVAALSGWNLVRPHVNQKLVLVLAIPLFLIVAGQVRLDQGDKGDSVANSSVISDGQGLGSVYSPLETWAQIIQPKPPAQEALLGPRWGATFVNTLTLPVPRQLWEDKPKGFGRELVEALEVQGVSENHSIAALSQGEWYANWGYAGLVWMVLVLGTVLALLDRAHARLCESRLRRPWDWWKAVALLCAVSSLADLYWVGTFTWFARGGLAAVMALLIGRLSTGRSRLYPPVSAVSSSPPDEEPSPVAPSPR